MLALQRAKTAESACNSDAGKGAEASASGAGASESKSGDAGDADGADAGGADAAEEHPHGAVALAGGQSMPVDVSGVVAVSEVPGKLLSTPDALPGGAGFMAPHGIRLNQILCLDYSVNGALLASGGEDKAIRIYDESRHAVARVLRSEYASKGGHANRVFALAFHRPAAGIEHEAEWEPWSLASAAWDQTVQLWDLRQARPTACCHGIAVGPRVEGEGLVYRGDEIIVASARPKDALQVWDRRMMGMGAKEDAREGGDGVRVVDWSLTRRSVIAGKDAATPLFAAAVSAGAGERAGGALLVAGGGNTNELRLFDRAKGDRHVATVAGMRGTVYSCDFSPSGKLLSIGGQRAKSGSGGHSIGAPLLRVLRIEGESSGDIASSAGAAVELSSPDSAAAGAGAGGGESGSSGKGKRVGFDAAQIDEALGGSMMGADDEGDAEADAVVDRMKAKQAAYHAQSADTAAAPAAVGESLPRVAGSGPAAVRALRARTGASAGSGADGTALADEGAPASSGAGADLTGNRDEPIGPISAGAGESKQGDAGD